MIIASAELAQNDSNWFSMFAVLASVVLFLVAIYLTARTVLTRPDKLATAPYHIRRASFALRWIAIFAPTLMAVGGMVELLPAIGRIGINGTNIGTPYVLFGNLILYLIAGFGVSLVAMFGIAVIFSKHRH